MTLTLNISDDLKPEELNELVDLARAQGRPLGVLLLDAARGLASRRKTSREPQTETSEPAAA